MGSVSDYMGVQWDLVCNRCIYFDLDLIYFDLDLATNKGVR